MEGSRRSARWSGVLATVLVLVAVWMTRAVGLGAPVGNASGEAKSEDLHKAEELQREADELREAGKYAEAMPLAKMACSILEKEIGKRSIEFAECLNELAVLYKDQGDYGKAERLYERALAINQRVPGSSQREVAVNLNNLAVLYKDQGDYGKATPFLERALSTFEKVQGPDHPDVAKILSNLADLYFVQGEYKRAQSLLERALSIFEKAQGPDHPDVAKSLSNLASLYYHQGDYGKAEPLLERSLAIKERTLGPEHPDIVATFNNLAALHVAHGEYGKARPLLEQGLAIRERALGHHHPDVAVSCNNLAMLYYHQGEYAKAEPLLERALTIVEKRLGSDHALVAQSLNNLATLYLNQGEYEKAELLHKRALAIRERVLNLNHPSVAESLNNLAELYRSQEDYGRAEPLHRRALSIRENALGLDHPDVANSLGNLALLYSQQGELGKAEPLHERALTIRENALGPGHPDVADSLNSLAWLYKEQGQYEKAELFCKQAVTIREKTLGLEHPLLAQSLHNLGATHRSLGRHDSAVVFLRRALDIQDENLLATLVYAEDYRRLAYASRLAYSTNSVLFSHLQIAPDHRPTAELALRMLLRRKGRVLDLVSHSTDVIRRSLPEEHRYLLDDISRTRDHYAHLTNRGPGPLTIEAFAKRLAEIQREQHLLWRELSEHSPVVDALSKPITIADVQRVLPSNSVLVEFVRYRSPRHNASSSSAEGPRYAAYIVFPDRFDWVDLGPVNPIDEHIKAFRQALQRKQAIPTDLHDAVIQPIAERIGAARRLFIAPDGDLNLIPFGALYDGKRYLIEKYALHYLTTGRDLLRPWDANPPSGDTVMVVANPTGANLPGAEHEAELLGDLFPQVQTLLHDAVTETEVQRRTQPWVIHLATHGFFGAPEPNPKLEAGMAEYLGSMSPSSLRFAPGRLDNPMLHSGLMLAPMDDEDTADGRLTAYEISGWDLRGTELVVLSACGTGLGEPRAGEGVLGLRRAFAMAGAQTQVMSLWDVPDSTTARLMEAYYRKLLDGKGRAEAMQEVQLEMLRSEEHHLPGDWASFVVVGEWRPLSAEKLPAKVEPPPVEQGCGCPRASFGGADQPAPVLLLGLLVLLSRRRERPNRGSCVPRRSGRGTPVGSMLIRLLGLPALRRRGR